MSDEARKLLAGKPFAAFVVCRRCWRTDNIKTVRKIGEKRAADTWAGCISSIPAGRSAP